MSDFAEKMAKLLRQLEAEEISPDQFEVESAKLIESVGETRSVGSDPIRREETEVAAKMLREL